MKISTSYISYSADETIAIAESLASGFDFPSIVCLRGDLGAGKTTFAKGFAKGLGVSEIVASPTFTLLNEYDLPSGNKLIHFDMYRLSSSDEAEEAGFAEYFGLKDDKNIILVEWAENTPELIPPTALSIIFEKIDDEKRKITLQ